MSEPKQQGAVPMTPLTNEMRCRKCNAIITNTSIWPHNGSGPLCELCGSLPSGYHAYKCRDHWHVALGDNYDVEYGRFDEDGATELATALNEVTSLRLALSEAAAARDELRKFAEGVVSLCEWGPSSRLVESDEDVWDAAMQARLLVEVPHAQPCQIEHCECDGSPTLCQFRWLAAPEVSDAH